ncbi:MAG TPA: tautomerase family protein [Actinotalea sp.]|jgi:phenylpyruvate tautomerase PptA (4-oxalocrotonate tautomerase family)
MPQATIELRDTVPPELRVAIADAVNAGIAEGLDVDVDDRFQVVHALPAEAFLVDPHFLGGPREEPVFVRVLMVRGYPAETKRTMFEAVARRMEAAGVRPEDVFIRIIENGPDDWYAGRSAAR